jgi:hypothetical protein
LIPLEWVDLQEPISQELEDPVSTKNCQSRTLGFIIVILDCRKEFTFATVNGCTVCLMSLS